MPLDDLRRFLNDPDVHKVDKQNIQALMASRLPEAVKLYQHGALQEALAECVREHDRAIESDIDANIVQTSYYQAGLIYIKLGDWENAVSNLQMARDLLKRFRVGTFPHGDLAEIMIEQGRYNDAIDICREWLEESKSAWAKQLLAKAEAGKAGRT